MLHKLLYPSAIYCCINYYIQVLFNAIYTTLYRCYSMLYTMFYASAIKCYTLLLWVTQELACGLSEVFSAGEY